MVVFQIAYEARMHSMTSICAQKFIKIIQESKKVRKNEPKIQNNFRKNYLVPYTLNSSYHQITAYPKLEVLAMKCYYDSQLRSTRKRGNCFLRYKLIGL